MVKNFSDCTGFQNGSDIFKVPPQCSMSISNTRFNRRAQLMHTEAGECGASSSVSNRLFLFFLAVRNNLRVQFGIRREYIMIANEIEPWLENRHSQLLHEFQW
ncbi:MULTISPECIES: hypothetical protein [Nitrosomonas]|uniref:hypothetical protein n=1 Tax=Nitrosomonas TaxID=914 RepID=UPI001F3676A5|nr:MULTISPECIES: hypothetical protein [Nitrosomonas]UVS60042.1 hypothetical protein NX761_10870 [Nitrosomonas sp. PLL12]